MPTPCGLTREELDDHNWVDENQRCKAYFEDEEGNEKVCNKLYASHPSSAQAQASGGGQVARLEAISNGLDALTLLVKTRMPVESKRGSDLSNADLYQRFSFGSAPLSEFVWDREGVTPITMFKCYGRVFRFVVKMARQYRRGAFLEVQYVQPATRFLLHQLSVLLLDDDAEVRREIKYKASEVQIHGRMDSGVFRSGSNSCFLSNEDKRMDEPLTESDICQAGAELAASVELLRNFAVNPLIFNSLLNSGREWKLLRRILHNSQPLWQFSSSLYVFNQFGEVDMDAVYVLTQMLVHCFSNSKYLINQSKKPVAIGYGLEDDTDNDFHKEEDEEEEEKEDGEGDEKEKFAVNTSNNKTLRAATGSKHVDKVKGTGGKSGKNTRKFGTVLTHENLRLFESMSKYEL